MLHRQSSDVEHDRLDLTIPKGKLEQNTVHQCTWEATLSEEGLDYRMVMVQLRLILCHEMITVI